MYPRFKENNLFLTDERISIAQVLSRYGYATAAFHSNPHLAAYFGYDRGFDVFEDHVGARRESAFAGVERKIRQRYDRERGFKILRSATRLFPLRTLKMYLGKEVPYEKADIINREAIKWTMDNLKGFFLWIHYMDVHAPYLPPQPLLEHFRSVKLANRISRGERKISLSDLKMLSELYDEEVRYVDHQLGLFLQKLKELGIWLENTYMIITSDHGEEFMEHGGVGHRPKGGPKLYDELLRVPLIIAGPELPRKRVDTQVALLDLAPTIAELVGHGKNVAFLGQSLVRQMKLPFTREKGVISEYQYKRRRAYSYRKKKWKYILTINGGVVEELYNLHVDPAEQENVVVQETLEAKRSRDLIESHISFEQRIDSATRAEKWRVRRHIGKIREKTGRCPLY